MTHTIVVRDIVSLLVTHRLFPRRPSVAQIQTPLRSDGGSAYLRKPVGESVRDKESKEYVFDFYDCRGWSRNTPNVYTIVPLFSTLVTNGYPCVRRIIPHVNVSRGPCRFPSFVLTRLVSFSSSTLL